MARGSSASRVETRARARGESNRGESGRSASGGEGAGGDDARQIDLVFENNRLASALYGEFDQHLALLERKLDIDARARGNMVTLSGPPAELALAKRVLELLYDRLLEGYEVQLGDVEGAIRMAEAEEAQLPLPTLDGPGRMQLARIATRKKSVVARTPMQDAYIRAMDRSRARLRHRPGGNGKDLSRRGARRGDA